MLYTLSQADYPAQFLEELLAGLQAQDAVVLWQNGVLQAVKFPHLFTPIPNVFVLENDLHARALSTSLTTISLSELVKLTEQHFPQVAW